MTASSLAATPHRRLNALTGEWVLVSPQRTERPWQGRREPEAAVPPAYEPSCYLCPGNARAGGARNPAYQRVFAFDNDFPSLEPAGQRVSVDEPIFQARDVRGVCRVLCFSPRHDLTLARMDVSEIRGVIDLWAHETEALGRRYRWVQVFENKGELMGCSNPHPHGQIWAENVIPVEAHKEEVQQRAYHERTGGSLLVAYLESEIAKAERLVVSDPHWVALVPFWAVWPFETLILPRRRVTRLPELADHERAALAELLKKLLTRYDNLFETSFPYTMGWHQAPFAGADATPVGWQLHAHVYPPLLRGATVRKFMVGYEMLSEPQRDITAEEAAARLRALPDTHYCERG